MKRDNNIIRSILSLLLILFTGTTALQAQAASEEYKVDLTGAWKLSYRNNLTFSRADLDDNNRNWKNISLPNNLGRYKAKPGKYLWLRKTVDLPGAPRSNLVLILGAVFDSDDVYFNGELIGSTRSDMKKPDNYGRPRIYSIPSSLVNPEENVIAIRIQGAFKGEIGILEGPVLITTSGESISIFFEKPLNDLIYAVIYLVIGVFFIILYFSIKELREYLLFGVFACIFSLMQFCRNELRFEIADWFLVYKYIEQISYTTLPTIFALFFIATFKIDAVNTKIKNYSVKRLIQIYAVLNLLTGALITAVMNPLLWDQIIFYWFFINLPYFAYFAYYTAGRSLAELEVEAVAITMGLLIMLLATIHFFAVERGLLAGPSPFSMLSLVFMLFVSFALIYRMIKLQLEVEDRQERLGEVNDLRDRVFGYLNSLVRKSSDQIAKLSQELFKERSATVVDIDEKSPEETMSELHQEVDRLENDLDDILELSRLEVIAEPEYVETVNFNDFITAVIPEGEITCYIKVNPEIELKTSLELVNSIVIRLIDFPGFKQFKHIDLIITSDLKQNSHFRFLMFHDNFRETRKLYDLLTSENPERGALWVKWGIIREITRILNGELNINIINRKFLRIDIKLAAEMPEELKKSLTTNQAVKVSHWSAAALETEQLTAEEGLPDNASPEELIMAQGARTEKPAPPFSKDMSVSEFIGAVRARLGRK